MKGSNAPIRKMRVGKKRWMVDLRYLGGKREFFSTKDEAETAREVKLNEAREHGTAALALSQADRVEFTVAKERLAKIGLTITRAVEFCEQHHREVRAVTILEALEELCREKIAAGNRSRSVANFRATVTAFAESVPGKLVSEVSRDEIVGWLGGNGWQPATIRTKRIDLQTFFRAGLARQWSTHDPTASLLKETLDDKPPGILTVEQCQRLLNGAISCGESRFVGWIALALFCGIRPEELEKMNRQDVNIDCGFVEVRAGVAKARKRRLVELSENCRSWLCVGLELPPVNYRGRLNKTRIFAEFEGYRKRLVNSRETWIKIPGEAWPHDCLRHSFGSYHLAMHGSADKTAVQMGHRSTDMLFRHYRELVTKQEAERFWGIRPN